MMVVKRRSLLLSAPGLVTGIMGGVVAGRPAARAEGRLVQVFYAGSLVRLMERDIGPAFDRTGGGRFAGFAGGSNKLAGEIKARLHPADVFISASAKVNAILSGPGGGHRVAWYMPFATAPLVIGYNPHSRFAERLRRLPWQDALQTPGLRLGRTDPALDPKGRFTVELLDRAERFYKMPGLARRVLGAPENPAQVLPEETLVGRLQSGELDAGFFYSFETTDLGIPQITLPAPLSLGATYTATILRDAPDPDGAQSFLAFLLGEGGRALLRRGGLTLLAPRVAGDAQAVPAALRRQLGLG